MGLFANLIKPEDLAPFEDAQKNLSWLALIIIYLSEVGEFEEG
jgi:hypothetical protein